MLWLSGAAGGIGRAVRQRALAQGWTCHGTDAVAADGVDDVIDVTDESAVGDSVANCVARHGRLDAVVHLAGRVGQGPLVAMTLADWRRDLDVNLTSAFLVARAAAPHLAASRGSLVLTSSINGLNGGSALSGPAYAAAKAALINLTRYLAKEWAAAHVRVNCVAPGPIATPMLDRLDADTQAGLVRLVPLGRLGAADDVAATILFLMSADAAFLTGTVHNVSGGTVLD